MKTKIYQLYLIVFLPWNLRNNVFLYNFPKYTRWWRKNTKCAQNQHEKNCNSLDGPRNDRVRNSSENPKSTLSERAEIESILSNRDIPASKCSQNRTLSDKRKSISRDLQHNVQCDEYLNPQHSRLNQPIDNYRGLSTINLQLSYPIIDPKDSVFYGHNKTVLSGQNTNSRFGNSTRLEAKDSYKKSIE